MPLRKGVDIDEILVPLKKYVYDYLNKRFSLDLDWRTPHYEFGRDLGLSFEEGSYLYYEFTDTQEHEEMSPIEGAVEGIRELKKEGSELHAITSRANFLRQSTERFLDTYFPGMFSGLEMGNHYNFRTGGKEYSKRELCEHCGVQLLIEDQIKYAEEFSHDIPVILFDKPWNQGFSAPPVYRAKNWGEIVTIARELNGLRGNNP